ncbi:hypothetical protein N665_0485s0001 [Sinapis alba]|nr:hypothetical protein N665_0485s0001 [Sinapis alba]
MANMVAFLSLDEGKLPTPKATADHLNPWSELKAPKMELKTLPAGLRYAFLGPNSTYPVIINVELNNVETAKLLCELRKFRRAIGYSLDDIPGISPDLCMHRIYLEDESRNSIEHQRRLNPNLKDVVKKEIMKLLEAGIIYAISDSNWASLVHVVPKKDGILIHSDDQEKTTFTCPYGTFAYRRMPFGLCNAPATFQRCMMSIYIEMVVDIMEVFMDDFSVYGSSFSLCLSNLCRVLRRCEEKDLVLNWEKCHFMVRDGIVLGHKISEKGIEVDKAKIEVMTSLQPPDSVKGIRSFLGHAEFYKRFIQDFSKIARPLTRLLSKDTKFHFNSECLEAFHTIKVALVSAPIVQPLNLELPFEVMCDASDYAEFDLVIKDKKGIENGVADHLSRLKVEEELPLDDTLPVETVYACADNVFRRCVTEEEIHGILFHCHGSNYAGHFATSKTVSKILQAGYWWPKMFKDAHSSVSKCDACKRQGNISKRNEMPQNFILEVEVFDV